ncbi:MAG: alanine--glyoxylate aminotransferase family protein [Saccharofermentans sp.]|nr:alanine--glyoxylate aminotransferase family protein [Saccharofermentans sp.]
MYKIMTPGPTEVPQNVMLARSMPCTNPDLDVEFVEDYKKLCLKISKLLNTSAETLILGGEGILGLEAACASLTEEGDRVLVIDNGVFGRGFQDFVTMYGGVPVLFTGDYKETIDVAALKAFLEQDSDFKYATVVHGDTPSGMLNDVGSITKLLKNFGILTVVDAVSTMFGEYLDVSNVDILCGGSQKVISAPPGLTINVVSDDAKAAINSRKTPIRSFYANLKVFFNYYEEKWFPYTMPISDINGLRAAIENIESDEDIIGRHRSIATATRTALINAGLKLYANSGYSNTVSVFEVPSNTTAEAILETMKKDHNIMIAGSFDVFAGKIIRIGHMGNNARKDKVLETLGALDKTFNSLGVELKSSLAFEFEKNFVE